MIPKVITREHVIEALLRIDREGVPKNRVSRKYDLFHEGRAYTPKYTVGKAAEVATGKELDPEQFSGGAEVNGFLTRLGFDVRPGRMKQGI